MSHGGGGDRWLVSYADFITLLMVLFVVLWSMSKVDMEKYKQLAESFKVAFGGGGAAASVVSPDINSSGGTSGNEGQSAPIVIPGIPKAPLDSVEVAGQLTDLLSSNNLGGSVSVQNNIEGVLISIAEKIVFVPGTAQLQTESYPVLDTIIDMVKNLDNEIRVVGHTDNTPPADPQYRSNWELSVARAMTIVEYMQSKGIAPDRMTASGRGEYEPIFPNDTDEHRSLNSRAEIIIIYSVESDFVNTSISPIVSNTGQVTP
jgi:chemotaxis protein MotB